MISLPEELDSVHDTSSEQSGNFSIMELITFTKSAFRPRDFEKLERLLTSVEAKTKANKEELEVYIKRCIKSEERSRKAEETCRALAMELEKKKKDYDALEHRFGALESTKLALEDDLKKYKRTSDELREQISRVEKVSLIIRERERRAEERITKLTEQLAKTERDGREKIVQLETENRDLDCPKRRAENEIARWEQNFEELKSTISQIREDFPDLTSRAAHLPENIRVDSGCVLSIACDKEKGKAETSGVSQKVTKEVTEEVSNASLIHLQTKERPLNCGQTLQMSTGLGPPPHSAIEGCLGLHDTAGSTSIDIPCEPFLNVKEDPERIRMETKVEYGTCVRKLASDDEAISDKTASLSMQSNIFRPAYEAVIEILDSDDELDTTTVSASKIKENGMAYVPASHDLEVGSCNEKEMLYEKCLKRTHLDDRAQVGKNGDGETLPLTTAPKRKRALRIISSSDDDSDNDKRPIAKPKVKKLQELISVRSGYSMKQVSLAPSIPSRGNNSDEIVTPLRRSPVTVISCEVKKEGAGNNSTDHIETKVTQCDPGCLAIVKAEKSVSKEVGSDGAGEKFSGFTVNGSDDSSDSEVSSTDSEDIADEIISRILRDRDSKSRWNFATEMLSSFCNDLELCMKAVCALYRQQISEKKLSQGSLQSNKRGFNKFDALRGTALAKFIMGGDPQGEPKKSVKELQQFDPMALIDCRRLACDNYKQLFEIYKSKEDLLFLPF